MSGRRMILGACAALSLAACTGGGSGSATSTAAPTTSMTYYSSAPTSTAAASSDAGAATSSSGAAAGGSSAAATASIAKPVMPAEAKAHTPAGAAAFARYYMDLVNYAHMKPDAEALAPLTMDTCKTCSTFMSYIRELRDADQRTSSEPFVIAAVNPGALVNGHQAVIISGHDASYRLVGPGLSDPSPLPSGPPMALQMMLDYESGWNVAAILKVR